MTLPPLPPPFMELYAEWSPHVVKAWEDQMRDYATAAVQDAVAEERTQAWHPDAIAQLVQQAIADEREACAKVLDDESEKGGHEEISYYARMIRARKD